MDRLSDQKKHLECNGLSFGQIVDGDRVLWAFESQKKSIDISLGQATLERRFLVDNLKADTNRGVRRGAIIVKA
jgi:hypothetical protein